MIHETWFQSVLQNETGDVDLIVVIGHTPIRNSTGFEFDLVLSSIRQHLPTIPVQFFGGHSHIRDFRKYDDLAHGIESGRYLETIGWVNMDLKPFKVGRRYVDNNLGSYQFHTEVDTKQEFDTQEGKAISDEIRKKVSTYEIGLMSENSTRSPKTFGMCAAELLYFTCTVSVSAEHLLPDYRRSVSETCI
jgi:2',3'-cyclic-nucleotide 2'-phosphodiesterase (5'-nucleotidase family)